MTDTTSHSSQTQENSKDYITVYLGDQIFGIPVLQIQDILRTQCITQVPLSPPEIAGSLNLRGRIVTAIDLRRRLGMESNFRQKKKFMNVVIEYQGELYSLLVDKVGEVLNLPDSQYENNPSTLEEDWRDVSCGIYRLKDDLLVILDVDALLDFEREVAA